MIYNGYFRDIKDSLYTVRITTKKGTVAKEITLSDNPFVTEMDESDETIYKPVKYQTATVEAISSDYMMDIYSATAQNTKVELLKDKEIVWTGYATPCLYDMGFALVRESIQIECQDALSTLQYFPYRQSDKQVRSFLYIIQKLLYKCNAYNYFYVADNTKINAGSSAGILDSLYISEQNFFDEKDDGETDDDVAWKCNEVLEEICRYLGLTAIADKDSVYFIDYDYLKYNRILTDTKYFKYKVGDDETIKPEEVKINFIKEISKEDYASDDATISLDSVYNKVTVKADLHDFEDVIPDMYENCKNITSNTDTTLTSSSNINNGMYGEVVKSIKGESTENNMIIMIDRIYNPQKKSYGDYNVVAVKYFNNPYYKFFKYDGTKDVTDTVKTLNYTDSKSMHGAQIAKFFVKKVDNPATWLEIIGWVTSKKYSIDDWMAKNEISDINFTNYIMLLNPYENHIANEDIKKYPYVQTTVTDSTCLFGGKNAYLVISGSYNFHYFNDDPYPIPTNEADIAEGRYAMDAGQTNLLCRLQWGKYYWDGSYWTTSQTNFDLPYILSSAGDDERRADATMFKDNEFCNTVSWRIGTSEKGYAIKVPEDSVMSGLPILTLFKPYDPNYHSTKSGDNKGQHYQHCCVFLKDFEIKAIIGDPTFSGKNDTDTEYSLDIDTDYVNELDEISFKINTWDNKKPNYSCVAYKDYDGSFAFLDKTYNNALSSEVKGMTFQTDDGDAVDNVGSLRQEWQLVYRLYKQYKDESVILNLTTRNNNEIYGLYTIPQFPDKYFIVDSINRNYRNNTQEIKLIEKK